MSVFFTHTESLIDSFCSKAKKSKDSQVYLNRLKNQINSVESLVNYLEFFLITFANNKSKGAQSNKNILLLFLLPLTFALVFYSLLLLQEQKVEQK